MRFASHYRFRPDFCEAADPESRGIVEALVRYGKDDFLIPLLLDAGGLDAAAGAALLGDLTSANERAAAWCAEVNAAVYSEVAAVPAERLQVERELLTPLPVAASPYRALRTPRRASKVHWTNEDCRRAGTLHLGGTAREIAAAEAAMVRGRLADRPFVPEVPCRR